MNKQAKKHLTIQRVRSCLLPEADVFLAKAAPRVSYLWPALVVTLSVLLLWTGPLGAAPSEVAKQQAEYNKMIKQRRQLHHQLNQLDHQAAAMLRRGEDPVTVHAKQVSLQDKLDLLELRLEIYSARMGVDLPTIDHLPAGQTVDQVAEDEANQRARHALSRGHGRAMATIERDAQRLLASIDFRTFLKHVE